jgi:hypothetical protein
VRQDAHCHVRVPTTKVDPIGLCQQLGNVGIIRARWCYHPWGFDLSMLMEAANLAAKSEQPVRLDALPH